MATGSTEEVMFLLGAALEEKLNGVASGCAAATVEVTAAGAKEFELLTPGRDSATAQVEQYRVSINLVYTTRQNYGGEVRKISFMKKYYS